MVVEVDLHLLVDVLSLGVLVAVVMGVLDIIVGVVLVMELLTLVVVVVLMVMVLLQVVVDRDLLLFDMSLSQHKYLKTQDGDKFSK